MMMMIGKQIGEKFSTHTLFPFHLHHAAARTDVRISENKWIGCAKIVFGICNEPTHKLFARRSWFPAEIIARGS